MEKKKEMKAEQICQLAADLVAGDRAKQHGNMLATHKAIADYWGCYLGQELTALDVARMMILLKFVRSCTGKLNNDDWVDIAGYAGCAGEISHD